MTTRRSLNELLNDLRLGDDVAARGATQELSSLGPIARDAVPDLIEALRSRSQYGMPQIELHATIALGQIGDMRAVTPLIGVLASSAPASRREAVKSLGMIGGPQALHAISAMLWDEDRHVRAAAAKILNTIAPQSADIKAKRSMARREVDEHWRGKHRSCPKCGNSFIAQQSRCKCAECLTEFFASHPTNPHEFPFNPSPPAC